MHHQFGIFAAALKIPSRSGPRPAPFSHSASAADEISASAGAASSASRNAFTPEPMNSVAASSSKWLSKQGRVAKRDREDHVSRDGRRALRPSLLWGAKRRFRRRPCAVRSGGTARPALGRRPVSDWNSPAPAARDRRRRRSTGAVSRPPGSAGAAARRRFCRPPRRGCARAPRAAPACQNSAHRFRGEQHVGERPRVLEMLGHRRGTASPGSDRLDPDPRAEARSAGFSRADQRQRRLDGAERRARRPSPSKQRIGSPAIAQSNAH